MRYANVIKNDVANGEGVCVSVYLQGCPHHCYNCFNPETWDCNGGKEFTPIVLQDIISAIGANDIKRNLCILGGEPLCEENLFLTGMIIREVKKDYPDIKIYLWTGYVIEELKNKNNPHLKYILDTIDYLIDGPFKNELRDISLKMRGSSNQRILHKGIDF